MIGAIVRAIARVVAPVILAFTLIAAITILSGIGGFLTLLLDVSSIVLLLAVPVFIGARRRFHRVLRQSDPDLAATLGIGQKLDWRGANTLLRNEALIVFLRSHMRRQTTDDALRTITNIYVASRLTCIVASASLIGGMLTVLAIAYSLLPPP
ncbi:MAG: hypothetical protein AB7O90_19635 [Hyphomicrobium sp.]